MIVGCPLSEKKSASVLCWYMENILKGGIGEWVQQVLWGGRGGRERVSCTPLAFAGLHPMKC